MVMKNLLQSVEWKKVKFIETALRLVDCRCYFSRWLSVAVDGGLQIYAEFQMSCYTSSLLSEM